MGFFKKLFGKKQIVDPTPVDLTQSVIIEKPPTPIKSVDNFVTKTYHVAGTSFRIDDIMKLACKNFDYDYSKKELKENCLYNERIYQYDFYSTKTELIPEPSNPQDPNAIKVIVDGIHIGYIKAGSCSHVLKLLRENRIKKIECTICGGKYKYLSYDEFEDIYDLEKNDIPIFAQLSISELK